MSHLNCKFSFFFHENRNETILRWWLNFKYIFFFVFEIMCVYFKKKTKKKLITKQYGMSFRNDPISNVNLAEGIKIGFYFLFYFFQTDKENNKYCQWNISVLIFVNFVPNICVGTQVDSSYECNILKMSIQFKLWPIKQWRECIFSLLKSIFDRIIAVITCTTFWIRDLRFLIL